MLLLLSCAVFHAFWQFFAWMAVSGEVSGVSNIVWLSQAWDILSFPLFRFCNLGSNHPQFWLMFGLNSLIWGAAGWMVFWLFRGSR